MQPLYHPFVLPFCFGVLALFTIVTIKFYRWITTLDKRQKKIVQANLFKGYLLSAFWEMFVEGLLHRKVSRYSRRLGFMHRSIALGWFLLIAVGLVETLICLKGRPHPPWLGIFYRYFVHEDISFASQFFANLMDGILIYVLAGVTMAVVKSTYSRVAGMRKTTRLKFQDKVLRYSLWAIFPLRLLAESTTACLHQNGGFLTQTLGSMMNVSFAELAEMPLWTGYSLALCLFFMLMPFSRYMHIFTELLLILFRRYGVTESEKPTGYTRMELSACSRCGICLDNCPMDKVLKIDTIQPVYYIRDIRLKAFKRITAENCLMCHQCETDCPVGIDISALRRQGRDKGTLDRKDSYRYINNVQPFNAIGRVAYFAGCMSHLTPGVKESMKKIFDRVGQKYWMMDEDRTICCGRPLMQQGFSRQAAELRRKNTNLIIDSGAKVLITSCPICYQSFQKEYHLGIRVMHHTEYLAMLIRMGKLRPNPSHQRVAYHDPCELGRGCGVYEAPREVLRSFATLVPAEREGKDSLCCGYNLGNTRLSLEQQIRLRDNAWKALTANHPDCVATACPMCKKAFTHSTQHPVKDIAELLAEQLTD